MILPKLDVLGTRVARRVLFLFMVSAAAPVVVMAVLSFTAIRGQVREQSESRLDQLTGIQTQSILGRLTGLAVQIRAAGSLAYRAGVSSSSGSEPASMPLPPGVRGLVLEADGDLRSLAGEVGALPTLSARQTERLTRGGDVLVVDRATTGASRARLWIASPLEVDAPESGRIWAEVVGDSIWSAAAIQANDPSIDDMCVLDGDGLPLYCASGPASALPARVGRPLEERLNSGRLEADADEGEHLVAWRDVYLRAAFAAPSWTVVVSEPIGFAYGTASVFIYNLLLVILIGIALALLVTHILVRRTMEPLRDLTVGTQRLAQHDLDARVEVRSKDEFGDLAASFNRMAERLGSQFDQLEARRAIDHAALTTSDSAQAIRALLNGVTTVIPSATRALALQDPERPDAASLFVLNGAPEAAAVHVEQTVGALPSFEDGRLRLAERPEDVPEVFRPLVVNGCRLPLLMFPLRVGAKPFGAIAIEGDPARPVSDDDSLRAQDLADQAAVALEKLRLDREVASMSWEALRALANAIDAKSTWTKGHSERVTGLSLAMGRELGLSDEDMDTLHRGGLLHDIGKIGVPAEVLDFDGVLTAEMRVLMEQHPEKGARILEPIRAFRSIIPIVLYHHERWDGSGYPEGLSGAAVPRLARLVAVADVFDAMVSPRPYRPALDAEVVWRHISERSGSDFDPEMVEALDRVMRGGWRPQETEGGTT